MSVRTRIAVVSIVVSSGVLGVACSVPSGPTEPSSSPSTATDPSSSRSPTTGPSELRAPAAGTSWLRVSPEQGAPNAAVSLDVACLDNLGAVHSPVLDIGIVQGEPAGHQPWHLFGAGTVRPDAAPGRYRISATCGAGELSTAFTVVPAQPR